MNPSGASRHIIAAFRGVCEHGTFGVVAGRLRSHDATDLEGPFEVSKVETKFSLVGGSKIPSRAQKPSRSSAPCLLISSRARVTRVSGHNTGLIN